MNITREELDDLYNRQRLSTRKIAARLGVTQPTVRYWMKKLGLPRRGVPKASRVPPDDEEIIRLYVEGGQSVSKIARRLGVGESIVYSRLKANGIERRNPGEYRTRPLDDEEVIRLYTVERRYMAEIAQALGVSVGAVRRRLLARGVPLRTRSENLRMPLDEDEIVRLYVQEHKSTTEIGRLLGVDRSVILNRLVRLGVERRTSGEAHRLSLDDSEIVRLYVDERMSTVEIAHRLGTNDVTILKRLRACGVERRSRSESMIIYARHDFSGDPIEKAYLQGFRQGDLTVKKTTEGPGCDTIMVSGSSTRIAQVNLYNELFCSYGRVGVIHAQDGRHHFWCDLNMSFDFLLPKQDSIPAWILRAGPDGDVKPLVAFVAGYTDAEGCFYLRVNGCAAFELKSYDVNILGQMRTVFNDWMSIQCPPVRLNTPKGTPHKTPNGKVYCNNGDCWQLGVYRKASLHRLCELLDPYLKHAKRRADMYAVWANVVARGV